MATFIDLVKVLLIQIAVICVVYPEFLHDITNGIENYNPDFKPYYTVIGIISGLTAVYLNK